MKVFILTALVAVTAAWPDYASEHGISNEAATQETRMATVEVYLGNIDIDNSEPMADSKITMEEAENEEEPGWLKEEAGEPDVSGEEDGEKAVQSKIYQPLGPTKSDQPLGPTQIHDPAPAAYDVILSTAPSANEDKVNAFNLKRQAAVNSIAKALYMNQPTHNTGHDNGVMPATHRTGSSSASNLAASYGAPNHGYATSHHQGYYGGFNGPRGYDYVYNHGPNHAQYRHFVHFY